MKLFTRSKVISVMAVFMAMFAVLMSSGKDRAFAAYRPIPVSAPYASLTHETGVVSADSAKFTFFDCFEPHFYGVPDAALGSARINFPDVKNVTLKYDDGEPLGADNAKDVESLWAIEFDIFRGYSSGNRYELGDSDHRAVNFGFGFPDGLTNFWISSDQATQAEADFVKTLKYRSDTEKAFNGQNFTILGGSVGSLAGKFADKIFTTEEQKTKFTPELGFVTNEGKVTKVKYRFIDPAKGDTLVRPSPDVTGIPFEVRRVAVKTLNGASEYIDVTDGSGFWYPGDLMEGSVNISAPFEESKLAEARIKFRISGSSPYVEQDAAPVTSPDVKPVKSEDVGSVNSDIEYSWRFTYRVRPRHGPIIPPGEKAQDKPDAVKEAAGLTSADVAEKVNISTNDTVFGDTSTGFDKLSVSSAIAVTQSVDLGGAVIIQSGLVFPVSGSTSLANTDLPKAANWEGLLENYHVWKSFEKGAEIDLLAKYPTENELFSFDGDDVTLLATLVIVDGEAPRSDPEVKAPDLGGGKYGVKLIKSGNGAKYLLVYDGYRNGVAADPIFFGASSKVDPVDPPNHAGSSSGGGGCDAGIGVLALLFLPVLAASVKKRG
ncbi:hypothetical protein FACS1894216_03710 [Synergistales bacterium]|nr:hypothetical protein FACS1894216_03710 [Synergistales bacterium]